MSLALHDLRRPLLVLALALPAWALLRLYQRRRDLSEKELQDYSALQVGARKFERPSHEQRVARGCIGNSFVAETKKLTLEYNWNPDKSVLFGTVNKCEGPPGSAHGGAIAAVLDDSMSQASNTFLSDEGIARNLPIRRSVTGTLQVKYGKRIPLSTPVRSLAYVQRVEDRKVYIRGIITNEKGEIYAEGTGVWIILRPSK